MTHTTFDTMTDNEIRIANENARALRQAGIAEGDRVTERIATMMIEANIKELNRRHHAEVALLQGIEDAYEAMMLDEMIFA